LTGRKLAVRIHLSVKQSFWFEIALHGEHFDQGSDNRGTVEGCSQKGCSSYPVFSIAPCGSAHRSSISRRRADERLYASCTYVMLRSNLHWQCKPAPANHISGRSLQPPRVCGLPQIAGRRVKSEWYKGVHQTCRNMGNPTTYALGA
jgi:hypothetical protein